jgi:hypothetical protein
MNSETLEKILSRPTLYARSLGYTKLIPELHDEWIRMFMLSSEDFTLQAHRESYKTTCVIVALTLLMVLKPNESNLLLRKDQSSVKEITRAIRKNLLNPITVEMAQLLYGKQLKLVKDSGTELHTNLCTDLGKKESQYLGDGIRSFSITGKHFSRIITDDIVTPRDRMSKAERQTTDAVFQELQNIKTEGGVILNSGTPWHKNDTFRLMPKPVKWTVYETGLMSKDEIDHRRRHMTASLFSANYELKHISDEESMFGEPKYGKYPNIGGFAQIDCAYGGPDTTALTVMCRDKEGVIHGFGQLYKGHVQDHYGEIVGVLEKYNAGTLYNETNGDKGYFAKEFRQYWPVISPYHESMNKHVKIVTFLKREWDNILWDDDTDPEYMEQIVDYQEGQDRDDAPDSASSLIREFNRGKIKAVGTLSYK